MSADAKNHAGRLERKIAQTMENIAHTNNCIIYAEDKKIKSRLKAKNDQRLAALEQMKQNLPGVGN